MYKQKKSQFILFSGLFLLLLILFIYSLETENSYISKPVKFNLLNNIIHESCMVGKLSNGTYIDQRFANFTIYIQNYCNNFDAICTLTITKDVGAPTNLTLLNYTHYQYSIEYNYDNYYYNERFNC